MNQKSVDIVKKYSKMVETSKNMFWSNMKIEETTIVINANEALELRLFWKLINLMCIIGCDVKSVEKNFTIHLSSSATKLNFMELNPKAHTNVNDVLYFSMLKAH